MKISKVEAVVLGITLAALLFVSGFFVGKNQHSAAFTVQTEQAATEAELLTGRDEASEETEQTAKESSPAAQSKTGGVVENKPEKGSESGPVDINSATADELRTLSGIGEVLAERILAYREEHGGFSEPEEIMNVYGIGESIYADICESITVGTYETEEKSE